jgi:hypothetical protein
MNACVAEMAVNETVCRRNVRVLVDISQCYLRDSEKECPCARTEDRLLMLGIWADRLLTDPVDRGSLVLADCIIKHELVAKVHFQLSNVSCASWIGVAVIYRGQRPGAGI